MMLYKDSPRPELKWLRNSSRKICSPVNQKSDANLPKCSCSFWLLIWTLNIVTLVPLTAAAAAAAAEIGLSGLQCIKHISMKKTWESSASLLETKTQEANTLKYWWWLVLTRLAISALLMFCQPLWVMTMFAHTGQHEQSVEVSAQCVGQRGLSRAIFNHAGYQHNINVRNQTVS